ncbi:hypothetical protein [Absidia glauca]|uniref:Uncharacterized protein n=1 Tax=Absidia glauca TaxID=4829 RepID=A0A168PYQ3_ABSGL|nr:hypothetical protein [Absidia glauca]
MDLFILWEHQGDDERKRRRKKLGPNDRNVVLVDQVRPDWQDQFNLKKTNPHSNDSTEWITVQQQRRNRRRLSGSMSGSGTTRRIIVRPAMQSSLTSRTM